jgi:hypothetical protein
MVAQTPAQTQTQTQPQQQQQQQPQNQQKTQTNSQGSANRQFDGSKARGAAGVPLSEARWGTQQAQSSVQGIPVANREGTPGTSK